MSLVEQSMPRQAYLNGCNNFDVRLPLSFLENLPESVDESSQQIKQQEWKNYVLRCYRVDFERRVLEVQERPEPSHVVAEPVLGARHVRLVYLRLSDTTAPLAFGASGFLS